MRSIPSDVAAVLAREATTLAHCWRLARRDGVVMGFTEHDRDLTFGGVAYAARSGLDAAETSRELGYAVSAGEVTGALMAAFLTERDLASGLYDGATVETWLVDWSNPETRLLLDVASIGEVIRSEHSFTAELRGLMHEMDAVRGGVYRAECAADLSDARCGIDLSSPAMRAEAQVNESDGRLGLVSMGLGAYASGWFTGGRLLWSSGANAGGSIEVKLHATVGGRADVLLWQPAPRPIATGDSFVITAGCDKSHATCRDRFANIANFRGFPHMPGNDFVVRYRGGVEVGLDGGSMFR